MAVIAASARFNASPIRTFGKVRIGVRLVPDAGQLRRSNAEGFVTNVTKGAIGLIRNVGTVDRVLRAFVVAPVAIVAAFFIGAGTVFGVVLFVVAAIMLGSAVTAFCPTYVVLGISTRPGGLHRVGHHLRAGHA